MFKKDFMWGVSTSSYQIEGANLDGKGNSIWDLFTKIENKIADGTNGDTACDSYNRIDEDIELLKELGVNSYRFSLSWPRIIPDGTGKINENGLKYYIDLVDKLLKANIRPFVTLFHWDLPLALQNRGGLLNDNFREWFKYYTDVVTKAFGDKVKDYITFNEPQVYIFLGHQLGIHAPGLKLTTSELLKCVHNLLLAHGEAVKVIRDNVTASKIGIAPCSSPSVPVNDNPILIEKCKEKYFSLSDFEYTNLVSIYSDPIFLGDYPNKYYEMFDKKDLPNITKEDLSLISQPLDYICQNIYSGKYYDLDENGNLIQVPFKAGHAAGDLDWNRVMPEVLYYGPKFLYERYKKPVVITENGISIPNWVSVDGKVHDPQRIDFINLYLKQYEKVAKEIEVAGYFHWSFLDNFEWACGFAKRFGLVYVDFETLKRTPKDSFYYYKDIIKKNGVF